MRITWQTVAAVVAVIAGVAVIAPNLLLTLVPVLVVLACPVSMLVMARSMSHTTRTARSTQAERDGHAPGSES